MHQLVGGSGEELFTGDKSTQVQRVVVRQQADHVVAGVEDQLADSVTIGRRLAEQRGGFLHVRVKLRANKIGDPLGTGEV